MHRNTLKQNFIEQSGIVPTHNEIMPMDASFRQYSRITTKDTSYIVMDSPLDKEPIAPFIKIATHLKNLGFSSPTIIKQDDKNGFLLLEDFGNDTFSHLLHNNHCAKELYTLATDTLIALHREPMITALNTQPYDTATYLREVDILIEWLYPVITGKPPTPVAKTKWHYAWIKAFNTMAFSRSTLVLRDFHAGNLMLLRNKSGIQQCGLLDFQDALLGHPAYDLMSLLQDVRLDVDTHIATYCYQRYKSAFNLGDDFDDSYTIIASQRHAKVLGIFIRLWKRDNKNKYLHYLPRTFTAFEKTLNHPALQDVQKWLQEHMPTLSDDIKKLQSF